MFVTTEPIDAYRGLIKSGEITADPAQAVAVDRLQQLYCQLVEYGRQMGQTGWRARLAFRGGRKQRPKGLYMWGGVGRGKTMLMDLFYEHSTVDERKHVHFHSFMQEVHRRLHAFREAQKAGKVPASKDPLPALARVIVDQAWLLCFDEFHVTDIADAMILGRLFETLWDEGVVVVATSNREPDELYKDGLQRDRFLPFIDLLKENMEVLELASATDYRLERLRALDVYMADTGPEAAAKLDKAFEKLTIGAHPRPGCLNVNGRRIDLPKIAEGVAQTSFEDLCMRPLGPSDYLAIAERFHTLILKDIPKMGPERRNEAKRFVTLIDALYEAGVNLICTAEAEPEGLYPAGDGSFEFERTVSRLMEMRSEDYMGRPHEPQTDGQAADCAGAEEAPAA